MTKSSQSSPARLLTIEIVADRDNVSPRTVRRWIKSGELIAYRLGRQWRISEADHATFLAARRGANLVSGNGY